MLLIFISLIVINQVIIQCKKTFTQNLYIFTHPSTHLSQLSILVFTHPPSTHHTHPLTFHPSEVFRDSTGELPQESFDRNSNVKRQEDLKQQSIEDLENEERLELSIISSDPQPAKESRSRSLEGLEKNPKASVSSNQSSSGKDPPRHHHHHHHHHHHRKSLSFMIHYFYIIY